MAEDVVRTVSVGPLSGWWVIRRQTQRSPLEMLGVPPTHWWTVVYRTTVGDILLGRRTTWRSACELARTARVEALVRVRAQVVDQFAELKAAMAAAGMPIGEEYDRG